MKIRRLDLLAFGPFTDDSLAFDNSQSGLHLIYGPNEAGKSSSLRALQNWLYGIPHNSRDNFLHPYPQLRIGGIIESAAGKRLEFIRRKGQKNTLRAANDKTAIEETLLTAMLGGVDEITFQRRFGIDYEELHRGGEEVVKGGGDLGAILFAAGSGMSDLGQIQKRLTDDADALFKRSGRNQRINAAISELAKKRQTVKEQQLSTASWKTHDEAVRSANQQLEIIETELLEKRTRSNHLQRIDTSLPLIVQRRELEAQLSKLADVPALPEDFSETRREALNELRQQSQAYEQSTNQIKSLEEKIAGENVPVELLNHSAAIERLYKNLSSVQKALQDRDDLQAPLKSAEITAQKLLEALGRPTDLAQAEQLRLSQVQRNRIRSLASQHPVLLEKQKTTKKLVQQLQNEINNIERDLDKLPELSDLSELKRHLKRIQKEGDVEKQLIEHRIQLSQFEQQATTDLKKLPLWNGSLEELEALSVPSWETIERFQEQLEHAQNEILRLKKGHDELSADLLNREQKLSQLQSERDVPDEAELNRLRNRRNEGWQVIKQQWLGNGQVIEKAAEQFIGEFAAGQDLPQAFENSIEKADHVADHLRYEADHVAAISTLITQIGEINEQISRKSDAALAAQNHLHQLEVEWNQLWSFLNHPALPPREMRAWHSLQQKLADSAAMIRRQSIQFNELDERIKTHINDLLQSIPAECNVSAESGLNNLILHCEEIVEKSDETNKHRNQLSQKLVELKNDLLRAHADAQQTQQELVNWQQEWENDLAALGLDRKATPSDAYQVIEQIDEILNSTKEAIGYRSRIEGIERDANEFEQEVEELLNQLDSQWKELPVYQAVIKLRDQLVQTEKTNEQLTRWKTQLDEEQNRQQTAQAEITQLKSVIDRLCEQAGCNNSADLPEIENLSARKRELQKEFSSINSQLNIHSAGAPLSDFIEEANAYDQDQLKAELLKLQEEISRLETQKNEVNHSLIENSVYLQQMKGGSQAAQAQEQVEFLLAQIRNDAEQYARYRLASVVLSKTIERFREASQGPVLKRASEFFSQLTLGSFRELRPEYDDKGNVVLVGIRSANGQEIHVESMSEGTADQLYLSLRLSMLEWSLQGQEPMPFIVDDILSMFDDNRSVAALQALSEVSEKTQVIVFTHHEHLVELAQKNLDASKISIHRLTSCS